MLYVMIVVYIAVIAASIAALWVIFTKAGEPGWASIVPIYNAVVLLKIVGKPTWWVLLYFIPCANIVVSILVMIELAKSFGKETGFGIGLAFLFPIFGCMLAFGDEKYAGPGGRSKRSVSRFDDDEDDDRPRRKRRDDDDDDRPRRKRDDDDDEDRPRRR
jgi:hypothetical protein